MTNGDRIIALIGKENIEEVEQLTRITFVTFKPNFQLRVENEWWNAKYKEPNTKFQEKIANAKPSTWLTDGLTEEEVKQAIEDGKERAKRNCEKCKHRIPTVDIVKGKSIYGCEKWECKFEPKERIN